MLGEYTISSLLLFNTFAVYMQHIGTSQAYAAAALAILSFGLTWLAMLGIFVISRRAGYRTRRRNDEVARTWPAWTFSSYDGNSGPRSPWTRST